MAPRPLPQSWSSPSPPTIAHCNGTQQWHHVHCTLQWCHVQSAKVVRRPPPLLEVRTPFAVAIWGMKNWHCMQIKAYPYDLICARLSACLTMCLYVNLNVGEQILVIWHLHGMIVCYLCRCSLKCFDYSKLSATIWTQNYIFWAHLQMSLLFAHLHRLPSVETQDLRTDRPCQHTSGQGGAHQPHRKQNA